MSEAIDTLNLLEVRIRVSEADEQIIRADAIKEYKQSDEYIRECVQRYLKGKADGKAEAIDECIKVFRSIPRHYYRDELLNELEQMKEDKQ